MRNLTRSFRRELPNAKTLSQKVAAILRTYGTDAHVYLPGIGVINGLTAGNYLDSVGATPATVDNPVGLVVDSGGINAIQATTANKPILRRGAVNLLTYSEQFDNAAWTKSLSRITQNQINSPIGTLTADLYTADSGLGFHEISQSYSFVVGTYTYSIYVKAGTHNFVQLYTGGGAVFGSVAFANFDLQNKVVGTKGSGATAKIELLNDDWLRLSITVTAATAGSVLLYLSFVSSASAARGQQWTTIGSETVYLWGAQLQVGTSPTDYVATTTAAKSSPTGNYHWVHDSTDLLTATYPAGYESATVINALAAGQQTLTAQNIVGSYSIGPSIDTYGRFIFRTGLTASELATMQTFANRLAGV